MYTGRYPIYGEFQFVADGVNVVGATFLAGGDRISRLPTRRAKLSNT
jgi:hypothetical protein